MKRDERRKASGRKNESRGQRGYKGDTRRAERRAMPNRDRRENPNNKYEDNSAFDDGLQLEGRNPVLEALNLSDLLSHSFYRLLFFSRLLMPLFQLVLLCMK